MSVTRTKATASQSDAAFTYETGSVFETYFTADWIYTGSDTIHPGSGQEGQTAPAGGVITPPTAPVGGLLIVGTERSDELYGTEQADVIRGNGGDDILYGLAGDDHLAGGAGNDFLDAGLGNDVIDGGDGDDFMVSGAGGDAFVGGSGSDTVSFAAHTSRRGGITVDLDAGASNTDDTFAGIENLIGTSLGDLLNGNDDANRLDGASGDDWLFGQGGSDTLIGGVGFDILRGGNGNDVLIGGGGDDILTGDDGLVDSDVFVFRTDNGTDRITDFQAGIDKIAIEGFDATPFGADGLLARGHYTDYLGGYWILNNFDITDDLLYNDATNQLLRINPILVDGKLAADLNAEVVATFDTFADLTTNDFLVG